jgi:hypothetical protein
MKEVLMRFRRVKADGQSYTTAQRDVRLLAFRSIRLMIALDQPSVNLLSATGVLRA